jgi:methionyl aminopeptidase
MSDKEMYLKVGKIHKEICEKAKPLIKTGEKLLDITKKIEAMVQGAGASLAFPVNLQLNNLVHYSPLPNDETVIGPKDLIKVDIGIHIDGYIADGAFTINFDPAYDDMVSFTEETLKNALKGLKPGMKISEIGKRLDLSMKDSKYKIIRNLSGHQLQAWDLHSIKSVPVFETPNEDLLEEGDALAVEIFITDGEGWIHSAPQALIYALTRNLAPVRNANVKKLQNDIFKRRKTLPFTERYVLEHLGYSKVDFFLLKKTDNLKEYPILVEKPGTKIAQFEDVIYVDKDKVIITTK